MIQLMLAIFTVSAMWLSQDRDSDNARYACVVGMCAQPFWYYTVFQDITTNWGVLVVTVFCTFCWFRGIVNNWLPDQYAIPIREFFLKFRIRI